MTIFNLGSINIDYIYALPHLVTAGETQAATSFQAALGGKGANQSIALARAGADVCHAGLIHLSDDHWLAEMRTAGVDCQHIQTGDMPTGHAIVAVDASTAENQIILSPCSNNALPEDIITSFLAAARPGDWALAQNETNLTEPFLHTAKQTGLQVCYSAAPFVADITAGLLGIVDLLVVNHIEAEALEAFTGAPLTALDIAHVIVTRGADGASYLGQQDTPFDVPAPQVQAVDTTGAGDTYLGYVLAGLDAGRSVREAMHLAAKASAIQVTRPGASAAIPERDEVDAFDG